MRSGGGQSAQFLQLGIDLYTEGRLEEAVGFWRQALEMAPQDVRAHAYVSWGEWRLQLPADEEYPSDDTLAQERTRVFTLPPSLGEDAKERMQEEKEIEKLARAAASEDDTGVFATHSTHPHRSLESAAREARGSNEAALGGEEESSLPRLYSDEDDEPTQLFPRETDLVAKLSPFSRIVQVGVPPPRLKPQAAFLLSLADGTLTLEELLDICAMPQDEALRLVDQMVDEGALVLED
jgi:tetratricopeptide (TPR) repeat protein